MRVKQKRYDTKSVQGQGTWVEMKPLSVEEVQEARAKLNQENNVEYSIDLLHKHLVAWNWTDEEGQPLPQPGSPGDFEGMTHSEFDYLCHLLVGQGSELKN